jgi:hypothetical protein
MVKNPCRVRHHSAAGTNITLAMIRKVKMNRSMLHEAYSSMRSTVPPKSSSSATSTTTPIASHRTTSTSPGALPGRRPAPMLNTVAPAVSASAGHPSWTSVSTM